MSDGLVGSAPPRDVAPATFLSHYVGLYLGEERCVRMAMIHVDEILCLAILFSFFFSVGLRPGSSVRARAVVLEWPRVGFLLFLPYCAGSVV